MEHAMHMSVILFSAWIAYTCFTRAIKPPKDGIYRWCSEVEAVNKNPLVRALMVLAGLLMLLIGIGVAVS
jgi:hypothetical protein